MSDGKAIAWLYQHGEVLEAKEEGDITKILVHIDPANQNRFESSFPYEPHQS
jgi:GTP-binding protein HflX